MYLLKESCIAQPIFCGLGKANSVQEDCIKMLSKSHNHLMQGSWTELALKIIECINVSRFLLTAIKREDSSAKSVEIR